MSRKILSVVGARPNFMKIGPVLAGLRLAGFQAALLHTGQHYDEAMNHRIFTDLGLPVPDINLEVGSASHAVQTAEIMRRFEPVLDELCPDAVLVVGDVNSTIACALVAAKRNIRVVHVEAGLRSGDRSMPEEINRILTDQLSDFLFTTEASGRDNLLREGIADERIFFVGNVMIDTLLANVGHSTDAASIVGGDDLFALVTLHRPSNVDEPEVLTRLTRCLCQIAQTIRVVFPMHPRTRSRLEAAGLMPEVVAAGIVLLPPQGYLEILGLMRAAKVVITDSGGLQEETTALGVPCLTVRENTERPVTIEQGTNTLVGTDPAKILAQFNEIMQTGGKAGRIPPLWDGKAGQRIGAILAEHL